MVLQCCQDRGQHNNMSILQWNIFLTNTVTAQLYNHSPISVAICGWKKAIHPSGRYFSVARQTNLGRSGCCLLALQGSMWAVIQTVRGSSQSASTGKPYHGAEASGHQANTSPKAKSGPVKNWCTLFCLVDMSHLQPRSSAPSTRTRAQGHSVKPLGNKDDIFWEAPGLYIPRGVCKLKGSLLPTWWEGSQDAAQATAEAMHCR